MLECWLFLVMLLRFERGNESGGGHGSPRSFHALQPAAHSNINNQPTYVHTINSYCNSTIDMSTRSTKLKSSSKRKTPADSDQTNKNKSNQPNKLLKHSQQNQDTSDRNTSNGKSEAYEDVLDDEADDLKELPTETPAAQAAAILSQHNSSNVTAGNGDSSSKLRMYFYDLQSFVSILNTDNQEKIQLALTRFILQAKYQFNTKTSEEFDLMANYLHSSPEVYELFRCFDLPNASYPFLAKLLDVLTVIISLHYNSNVANNKLPTATSKFINPIIRKLFRTRVKYLYKLLHAEDSRIILSALRFLLNVGKYNIYAAKELISKFNFSDVNFQKLPNRLYHKVKSGQNNAGNVMIHDVASSSNRKIRDYYVEIAVTLLNSHDSEVIQSAINVKNYFISIFKHISLENNVELLQKLLNSLEISVISNNKLPNHLKFSFFNSYTLELLLKSYEKQENPAILSMFDAFLRHLITKFNSFKQARQYFTKNFVVLFGKQANFVDYGLEFTNLLFFLFKLQPFLLNSYYFNVSFAFEPRLSARWLNNINILIRILREFSFSELNNTANSANLAQNPENTVNSLLSYCFPRYLAKNFLSLGLQHTNLTVKIATIQLLLAFFVRFAEIKQFLQQNRALSLLNSFSLEFRKRICDFQLIFSLRSKLSGAEKSAESQENGAELLYKNVLLLIRAYAAQLTELLAESRVDLSKLLLPVDICGQIKPFSSLNGEIQYEITLILADYTQKNHQNVWKLLAPLPKSENNQVSTSFGYILRAFLLGKQRISQQIVQNSAETLLHNELLGFLAQTLLLTGLFSPEIGKELEEKGENPEVSTETEKLSAAIALYEITAWLDGLNQQNCAAFEQNLMKIVANRAHLAPNAVISSFLGEFQVNFATSESSSQLFHYVLAQLLQNSYIFHRKVANFVLSQLKSADFRTELLQNYAVSRLNGQNIAGKAKKGNRIAENPVKAAWESLEKVQGDDFPQKFSKILAEISKTESNSLDSQLILAVLTRNSVWQAGNQPILHKLSNSTLFSALSTGNSYDSAHLLAVSTRNLLLERLNCSEITGNCNNLLVSVAILAQNWLNFLDSSENGISQQNTVITHFYVSTLVSALNQLKSHSSQKVSAVSPLQTALSYVFRAVSALNSHNLLHFFSSSLDSNPNLANSTLNLLKFAISCEFSLEIQPFLAEITGKTVEIIAGSEVKQLKNFKSLPFPLISLGILLKSAEKSQLQAVSDALFADHSAGDNLATKKTKKSAEIKENQDFPQKIVAWLRLLAPFTDLALSLCSFHGEKAVQHLISAIMSAENTNSAVDSLFLAMLRGNSADLAVNLAIPVEFFVYCCSSCNSAEKGQILAFLLLSSANLVFTRPFAAFLLRNSGSNSTERAILPAISAFLHANSAKAVINAAIVSKIVEILANCYDPDAENSEIERILASLAALLSFEQQNRLFTLFSEAKGNKSLYSASQGRLLAFLLRSNPSTFTNLAQFMQISIRTLSKLYKASEISAAETEITASLTFLLQENGEAALKWAETGHSDLINKFLTQSLRSRLGNEPATVLIIEFLLCFACNSAYKQAFHAENIADLLTAANSAPKSVKFSGILNGKLILDLVLSHSGFLPLILPPEEGQTSVMMLRFLLILLSSPKNGPDLDRAAQEALISTIFAAFSASYSAADAVIMQIFAVFDAANGGKLLSSGRKSGEAGRSALAARSQGNSGESNRLDLDFGWIYRNFSHNQLLRGPISNEEQLNKQAQVISISKQQQAINLGSILTENSAETAASQRASHYNPAYLLPFLHNLFSTQYIEPRRLLDSGLFSFVLLCLSLEQDNLRALAYQIVAKFFLQIEAMVITPEDSEISQKKAENVVKNKNLANYRDKKRSRTFGAGNFLEQPQILLLLTVLKNGITQQNQLLPSILMQFVAKSVGILLKPEHELYKLVNRFLLQRPALDFTDLPLFYVLLHSNSSENHKFHRSWLLNLIQSGLLGPADYIALRRRHAVELLLALHNSRIADRAARIAVLAILQQSLSVDECLLQLLRKNSIFSWLRSAVESLFVPLHSLIPLLNFTFNLINTINKQLPSENSPETQQNLENNMEEEEISSEEEEKEQNQPGESDFEEESAEKSSGEDEEMLDQAKELRRTQRNRLAIATELKLLAFSLLNRLNLFVTEQNSNLINSKVQFSHGTVENSAELGEENKEIMAVEAENLSKPASLQINPSNYASGVTTLEQSRGLLQFLVEILHNSICTALQAHSAAVSLKIPPVPHIPSIILPLTFPFPCELFYNLVLLAPQFSAKFQRNLFEILCAAQLTGAKQEQLHTVLNWAANLAAKSAGDRDTASAPQKWLNNLRNLMNQEDIMAIFREGEAKSLLQQIFFQFCAVEGVNLAELNEILSEFLQKIGLDESSSKKAQKFSAANKGSDVAQQFVAIYLQDLAAHEKSAKRWKVFLQQLKQDKSHNTVTKAIESAFKV
jgi:hypothetical protein